MDILKNILNQHGSTLLSKLTDSGFTLDQAKQFLPEASDGLLGSLKNVDLGSLLSSQPGEQVSSLMNNIDIGSIAAKLGLDTQLVQGGFQSFIPSALALVSEKSGGLDSLLGGLKGDTAGGLMGMAKKLF